MRQAPSTHLMAAAALMLAAGLGMASSPVIAQERKSIAPLDRDNPLKELISGYYFGALRTRALQDDDFDNPGFAWYDTGEKLWTQEDGAEKRACASCHENPVNTMRGKAASYPKFSSAAGAVVTLEQRINLCREANMKAAPWPYGSNELLSMAVFLRAKSRGLPVDVGIDGPAKAVFERGRSEYETKIGQFNMACADCHDKRYGQSYRGEIITQGHSNGFPTYQLRPQAMTSLHQQFRSCNLLVRAEPREPGSAEYVALELYLAWRGRGLPIETPAVRR
jgi:sulfur-oxidizing protein SoxA